MADERGSKQPDNSEPGCRVSTSKSGDNGDGGISHSGPGWVGTSTLRYTDRKVADHRSKPESLRLIREIPDELHFRAVEDAVQSFIEDTEIEADHIGLFNQTVERIAGATFLRVPGHDYWIISRGGKVVLYVLASFTKDVDNRLCYFISQLWAHKSIRFDKPLGESVWKRLQDHAKRHHCAHIILASVRDGWERYLSHDVHKYVTLLKKDLEV